MILNHGKVSYFKNGARKVQESSYIRKQRLWKLLVDLCGSGVRQTGAGPVTSLGLNFFVCKMGT